MDANGELTATELVLLRTHPQRTDLYIAIPTYATVYTAVVVAPVPATNDGVYQVTFNGGAGATWANVVAGMTLMIGTVAGGSDVGFARIRKVITTADAGITGTIYIGMTSEIDFAAGQFLTITNEFGLRPRHPYVDPATGEEFMDWDIDYDTVADPQHVYFAPVPVMYPSAVVKLTGASVSVAFDALASWVPGAAPGGYTYLWTCAGANPIMPDNLPGATITFTAAGTYLVALEMSADYAGGHSPQSFGYRYVIVYDDANPLIKSPVLESCSGDFDNGGWSYRVTCYSQANLATIHNRTLCLLVADDWYGTTHQSIGPIAGRENVVCIGWIDGESITWSNDMGKVSFDVQGPQWWLDKMQGYPTGVDDSLVASIAWTEIETLTARKGLWHFLYWRTTAAFVMDIPSVARHGFTTPDTRRLATTYTPAGSLLEQLRAIADRIFARATCNRYGQLFINVDNQLVDPTIRGTHPNIMGVAGFMDADWRDEITIERLTVPEVSLVDLSGIYWSGMIATSSALFSLSPGHYFKHYGRPAKRDRVSLADQAQANMLAGLYLGWLNNEYPNIDVPLSSNNRAFDIAPYQFSLMSIAAGDTPRGIEWTDKRIIPRRVSFQRDDSSAVMLTDVTFEAETFANTAMIGDPPIVPPDPPPPPDPPDPPDPPLPEEVDVIVVKTADHLAYSLDAITSPATCHWVDITPPGCGGSSAAEMMNFVVSSTGEIWVVVASASPPTAVEGVWYAPNVLVPVWSRILATQDARDLVGVVNTGDFASICLAGGEAYVALTYPDPSNLIIDIWYGNAVLAHTTQSTAGVLPALRHASAQHMQFSMSCSDNATAKMGLPGPFGNEAHAINLITGVVARPTTAGYAWCHVTAETMAIAGNIGNVGSIYAQANMDLPLAADAMTRCPLIEYGGNYFWMRGADFALMINLAIQAYSYTIGVTTGIFGDASATAQGGGWCFINGVGEIVWAAVTPVASNQIRNLAMTLDGGFNWVSIDGDWETVIEPAGYMGGARDIRTVVRYVRI